LGLKGYVVVVVVVEYCGIHNHLVPNSKVKGKMDKNMDSTNLFTGESGMTSGSLNQKVKSYSVW